MDNFKLFKSNLERTIRKNQERQERDAIKRMESELLLRYRRSLDGFRCPNECGVPLEVSVKKLSHTDRCPKLDGCCEEGRALAAEILAKDYERRIRNKGPWMN